MHEPHSLVNLVSPGPRSGSVSCGQPGTCDAIFSYLMFRDLERVQTVFTGIAAHRDFGANIAFGGVSEGGDCTLVSGSYFEVLGLTPHLGRLLNRDDDRQQGGGRVTVLSYDYWRAGSESDPTRGSDGLVNGRRSPSWGRPRGFTARRLGVGRSCTCDLDARGHRPALEGPTHTVYWAYLFARLDRKSRPKARETSTANIADPQGVVCLAEGMRPSMLANSGMQMRLETGLEGRAASRTRREIPLIRTAAVWLDGDRPAHFCANVRICLWTRAATVAEIGRSSLNRARAADISSARCSASRCCSA